LLDHGIDVDLPQASKQRMKEKQEKVTISVAKENRIYLDNAKISILKLEQRLKQIKEANKNIAIVLRADKKIPYKNIINILDIVKKAKIDNISLAVRGK
jgi:biopolymer transport protein TolR